MSKVHYVAVEDRDLLVLITNPQPSVADPENLVQTTLSTYRVVSEDTLGARVVESRHPVKTYSEKATTEQELRDVHQRAVAWKGGPFNA